MNNRIQELVKECETTSTTYFDGRGNVTSTDFDRYKFAELIVRECAMAALKLESTPDWYLDSVSVIPHHCSVNILKHFGVEE